MDGQSPAMAAPTPAGIHVAYCAPRPVRLLDQTRWQIRQLHYSRRTEDAYVYWCRAFIRFHGLRHPAEMGVPEMEAFLGWLANERRVATLLRLVNRPEQRRGGPREDRRIIRRVGVMPTPATRPHA